ncbi:MAG: hypothetical protein WAW59_06125 [Patescibacteria group bacterium]
MIVFLLGIFQGASYSSRLMSYMMGGDHMMTNNSSSTDGKDLNELVLVDDETTTDVQPTEVVNLKDGDTYDLTIQKVRRNINGKTFIMLSYNGSIP